VKKDGRLIQNNRFTEDWFIQRGYTKNAGGGYDPPKFKHKSFEPSSDIPVKEKVVQTPDFEYKPIVEWFIPYQVPSKKNSRITFTNKKTGKVINIPSKAYTEYKNATKAYWIAFGKEFKNTMASLKMSFPVNIEMTFIRKTNQVVDYFGPGESVFDLMSDFGWWSDDSVRFAKPFFGDMIVDKSRPGVIIKLLTNK